MNSKKQKSTPVTKPFLMGKPIDENTLKNAAKFFGLILVLLFMVFVVCSMAGFQNKIIRIAVNIIIEGLILAVLYNRGADHGTDAVAKGEILYQHLEKGEPATEQERRLPYHPAKGFVTGFLGVIVILIPAFILSFTATKTVTGSGLLPDWMENYIRRTEIGKPLVAYTNPGGIGFLDAVRIFVRISIMPFVNIAGAENKDGLLFIEKISPLILLLPSVAYGCGYLQGKKLRSKIHTEISENAQKRIRRERKARKQKAAVRSREPQQLN